MAHFNREQADIVRRMYADTPGLTQERLASEFGVSVKTIGRILRKETFDGPGKHKRKLTPEQVQVIRARFIRGVPKKHLAEEYGVSVSSVTYIVTGVTYREVPESQDERDAKAAPAKYEAILQEVIRRATTQSQALAPQARGLHRPGAPEEKA